MPIDPNTFGEADFVKHYAATEIKFGDRAVSLATALEMEASLCPADPEKLQDPDARLGYLARLVGEQLDPEHHYLLGTQELAE